MCEREKRRRFRVAIQKSWITDWKGCLLFQRAGPLFGWHSSDFISYNFDASSALRTTLLRNSQTNRRNALINLACIEWDIKPRRAHCAIVSTFEPQSIIVEVYRLRRIICISSERWSEDIHKSINKPEALTSQGEKRTWDTLRRRSHFSLNYRRFITDGSCHCQYQQTYDRVYNLAHFVFGCKYRRSCWTGNFFRDSRDSIMKHFKWTRIKKMCMQVTYVR